MHLAYLALAAAALAGAQQQDNREQRLNCSDREGSSRRGQYCEMKETALPAAARLSVDGRANGGIAVKGWSQSTMLLRYQVRAWAETDEDARSIANQIRVETASGQVRSEGPAAGDRGSGRRESWSVSYEIFVPHRTDLSLTTTNGGVSVSDVSGRIDFRATNGGVSLKRLAGDVRGRTTNGGLSIELAGDRWEGGELNVETTNGGVSMTVPANYSAQLETETVNGRLNVDFPVTVSGKIDRRLSTSIGGGGPRVRAVTSNGGVSIKRKS